MERPADADPQVLDVIRKRWSPYQFSDRRVEPEKLRIILDAARWAANSFNEQPWRYIVATKDNPREYERMLACLNESNQVWARCAPVLMLSFAKRTFTHNGHPNRVAWHDVGAASCQLTLQAEALGLRVHQMAGIETGKIPTVYSVPEDFEPIAALAIGYPGENLDVPEHLRQRDNRERTRKPLDQFVFEGTWGQAPSVLKG